MSKEVVMNIESKWLEDFLILAEVRSFSKAAQIRNMTQPAFSRRIQSLEETVGSQLIDRSNVPISLTPVGSVFRTSARNLMGQITETINHLKGLSNLDGRVIKVAAAHSLANSFASKLHDIASDIIGSSILNIEAIDVDRAIEALQDGECDILLSFHNELLNLPPYLSLLIGEAKLLPVSACDNKGLPLYKFSEEKPCPYLSYSRNSYMGRQIEKVRSKVNLNIVFSSSMTDLLKQQVINGKGIAWLPDYAIEKELETKQLTIIGNYELVLPISFYAYRYQARLHESGERFWNELTKLQVAE